MILLLLLLPAELRSDNRTHAKPLIFSRLPSLQKEAPIYYEYFFLFFS
jgi:hypothetical protein